MKRSVAMMACVLSGALMIGSYSPVLAEGAKAVSAKSAEQETTEETKTDESSEGAKADDTAKGDVLEDGVYTAEFETDSSMFHANEACDGKGTLTVKDGKVTAKIVWSSKNYDYMKVGDTKYDAVIEDEHSTFEIPVSCFDWAIAVSFLLRIALFLPSSSSI